MAFWDKRVIMNSPTDVHSSPSVYTAFYKGSTSFIVLEFATPLIADFPCSPHRERMLVLQLACLLTLPEVMVKVKVLDVRQAFLELVKDTILFSDEELCDL